jgi:tripeptidyl-peptidase-1
MGFINPWIYAQGSDFIVDITAGKSRGCSGTNFQTGTRFENAGIIPGASWNGTTGWDAATGLGVPDFQKMLASAMKVVGAAAPAGVASAPAAAPVKAASKAN